MGERDETELRAWIEEKLGISVEGNLLTFLRNGQVLCNLANKIQPGAVPKVHRTKTPYFSMLNVQAFLRWAKENWLSEHQLFVPADLQEDGAKDQVIKTLLALRSSVLKFQDDNIEGSTKIKEINRTLALKPSPRAAAAQQILEKSPRGESQYKEPADSVTGDDTQVPKEKSSPNGRDDHQSKLHTFISSLTHGSRSPTPLELAGQRDGIQNAGPSLATLANDKPHINVSLSNYERSFAPQTSSVRATSKLQRDDKGLVLDLSSIDQDNSHTSVQQEQDDNATSKSEGKQNNLWQELEKANKLLQEENGNLKRELKTLQDQMRTLRVETVRRNDLVDSIVERLEVLWDDHQFRESPLLTKRKSGSDEAKEHRPDACLERNLDQRVMQLQSVVDGSICDLNGKVKELQTGQTKLQQQINSLSADIVDKGLDLREIKMKLSQEVSGPTAGSVLGSPVITTSGGPAAAFADATARRRTPKNVIAPGSGALPPRMTGASPQRSPSRGGGNFVF